MKKGYALIGAMLLSFGLFAQTPLPGKQDVDKTSFEGLYVTTKIEDKYLEKYWESYLKQNGKVSSSRGGVYRMSGVTVPRISSDPVNIVSKVSSAKGGSQVFMYVDLGNGAYVTQGTKGYTEAEAFLRDFAASSSLYDESRVSEDAMKDAEKAYNKLISKGERLKKDIDKTAKELEELKKDLEINQKDQTNSQADLEEKKKAFDNAKAKLPGKN